MKINAINPIRTNFVYNGKNKYAVKKAEAIGFSSKNTNRINPRIRLAVDLGAKLYGNPNIPPEKIIKRFANDIEVIHADSENPCPIYSEGVLTYMHNKDFRISDIKLYVEKNPSKSKKKNIERSLILAHEYTHYLQFTSLEYTNFIKKLSGGDYDYLTTLVAIGDGIYEEFDNMKFGFTDKIFNFLDIALEKMFSFPVSRKKSFKKEDILKSKNLKSDKEFNRYIQDKYNKIFDRTMEIIATEDDVDEDIKTRIEMLSSKKGGIEKLKRDLRTYCVVKAKYEYEAYMTESLLLKKILNDNSQRNTDSYIMYYSMLEKALK